MYRTRAISNRRPPLAEQPQRPAQRILCPNNSIRTSPVSLAKTQLKRRSFGLEELALRPEFQPLSCEFEALAKMVEDEFGNSKFKASFINSTSTISSPLFERGRFYDVYSARRTERLKRKKRETEEDITVRETCDFSVEFGKRTTKKMESLRKSVPANFSQSPAKFSVSRREGLRSSVNGREGLRSSVNGREGLRSSVNRREGLRSSVRLSKENKAPVLSGYSERSAIAGDKKRTGSWAVRKS